MSVDILVSFRIPSAKLKVGSVIVKDNRFISSGYNCYPSLVVQHTSLLTEMDTKSIQYILNKIQLVTLLTEVFL